VSNLSLFKSGSSVIPDYLRDVQDDTTKDIAGSSGGKQISIKGGVWRMVVGGEEVAKNEDRSMNFVVIATGKGVSRTFYMDKYEEGKDIKPACWSAEGVVPNSEVPSPQSNSCATCVQNIEGSGEGKSRACRYSKRIAVALESDISGNVYRLSVPAKSYFGKADGDKMPLQAFGKFLSGHGIPITGIVTEARFDTSEAVPVLKFRAVRPLERSEWEAAKLQSQSEDAKNAVEFKMVPSKVSTETLPALPQAFRDAPAVAAKADDAPIAEPIKRTVKAKAEPAAPKNVADILSDWSTDDDA
tara:strand:- start:3189 stop:4088 length:900 start_codon:yes stop_codon:yes gene_type:complete